MLFRLRSKPEPDRGAEETAKAPRHKIILFGPPMPHDDMQTSDTNMSIETEARRADVHELGNSPVYLFDSLFEEHQDTKLPLGPYQYIT